jgi:hypothetical protein
MSVRHRRIAFTTSVALCACFVAWIVTGETSPLADYFLYHTAIPNMWMKLHIIPYLIQVIVRPEIFPYLFAYGLVALQWMLVGYLVSRLVFKTADGS